MKKLLLTLILTFISTGAMAEWTYIGSNADNTKAYADLSSLCKTDNGVKMWILHDYNTAQNAIGDRVLSEKSLDEYSCEYKQRRTLTFFRFNNNMGNGSVIYSSEEKSDWDSVRPNSIDDFLYKAACGQTNVYCKY